MRWICFEPHTHTNHSDAKYTVDDLLEASRKAKLDVITLTDHNTDSGYLEIPEGQVEPYVIRGIEWTTFYGHVVITGPSRFVEFRDLTPDNLKSHIDEAHRAGATVQIAHPFVPGEPFCCGCHWEFRIDDWNDIDTMEVWSEGNPDLAPWNTKAYKVWQEKLLEGYRPVGISARDWHEDAESPDMVFGVNYLLVDESLPLDEAVKDAIRAGRVYVTAGPVVDLSVNGVGIGMETTAGKASISVIVSDSVRKDIYTPYCLEINEIVVVNNKNRQSFPFEGLGKKACLEVNLQKGFVFVEIRGKAGGKDCKIAFTNPVFVE